MPDFLPDSIAIPSGHFIDGMLVGNDDPLLEVLRPSDGRRLGDIPDASETTVDEAVRAAHRAWRQSDWATRPPRERARVLRRWADLILREREPLARLEAVGSTRPIVQALEHEVPFTAEALYFFAEYADKVLGSVVPTRRDSLGMIVAEPYGVVGAIAPWNFPLSMASWKCGPALAAGNAIVLKPSELTPFSTLRMAQLAIEAGMPPGIFNVVNGRGVGAGASLVRHPLVRKVSFTGSTAAGAAVMSDAAHHGTKPVTLELGGKSPQLVFDDAGDVAAVAGRVARGFLANAGQACVCGSRLIVQRNIAEPLLEAIQTYAATMVPGPTWSASTNFSPLISAVQAGRVQRAVSDAVSRGAQARIGNAFFDESPGGYFYRPTILDNLHEGDSVLREEIFGPVLTVQRFDDEEEGIALAGHPVYGLAAGVHTLDMGRAMRAMRAIEAGTVWVNRYSRSGDFIIPTGGFNQSGIGKDLGRQAVEANLRYKSVLIDF